MVGKRTMNLRAGFLELKPYIIASTADGSISGPMMTLLNILSRMDGFNTTLFRSPDGLYGNYFNGSWNGILGLLERNEVDLSLVPMTLFRDRYEAFSSSSPFLRSTIAIVFGTKSSDEFNFYSTLDKKIVGAMVAVTVAIYFVGVLNKYCGKSRTGISWTFLTQCLLGTSPLATKSKQSGVVSFLKGLWCLSAFFILVNISSRMTSKFSTTTVDTFDSMNDIFRFPFARPILLKGAPVSAYYARAYERAYNELIRRANMDPNLTFLKQAAITKERTVHIGVEKRQLFVAAVFEILWELIRERFAASGNCKIKLSRPITITSRTIYFRKNFSRTAIGVINKRIRRLIEGDCFGDFDPTLKPEFHPCHQPDSPESYSPINTFDLSRFFRVCVVGFLSSFFAIFVEVYIGAVYSQTRSLS